MPLIGLSFDGEVPLIIMLFMSKGNVLGYVREHKETLYLISETKERDQVKQFMTFISSLLLRLIMPEGLGICYQIPKGMSYLTNFKFVYCDLAARNCM